MTLAASIADDYLCMDGVETVTLVPADGSASVTTVKALKRRTSYTSALALGAQPTGATFHLWVSTLGSTRPKRGDSIVRSDLSTWVIVAPSLETLDTRWRCVCNEGAVLD